MLVSGKIVPTRLFWRDSFRRRAQYLISIIWYSDLELSSIATPPAPQPKRIYRDDKLPTLPTSTSIPRRKLIAYAVYTTVGNGVTQVELWCGRYNQLDGGDDSAGVGRVDAIVRSINSAEVASSRCHYIININGCRTKSLQCHF